MISLEQFRATGVQRSVKDASEILGVCAGDFGEASGTIWVYEGGCWIFDDGKSCTLTVYHYGWTGDRADLERELYLHFYVSEVDPDRSREDLQNLLLEYSKGAGAGDHDIDFLRWFVGAWEIASRGVPL